MHYWADLQSVHRCCCYDNIAPNAKCQRVLVLALFLVVVVLMTMMSVCSAMISEDSDYTSDVSYPLQHPCYGVTTLDDVDYAGCYPNDVTVYPASAAYDLRYPGHVVRQPAALIGRRFYDEEDDWRGYEEDASDLYRSAMAYRCRFGADWEFAEPLSYNSRPARFYPCDRYTTSIIVIIITIIILPSVSRIPRDLGKINLSNCRSDHYSGQSSQTNES